MAAVLEQPALRHYQKWPILGNYVWPNNFIGQTFQEEVNYLKTWIAQRAAWMDANMFGTCTANVLEPFLHSVKIYPNPSSAFVNITGLPSSGSLQLLDLTGKIIQTITYEKHFIELDLSTLLNGIYLISDPINGIHEKIIKK